MLNCSVRIAKAESLKNLGNDIGFAKPSTPSSRFLPHEVLCLYVKGKNAGDKMIVLGAGSFDIITHTHTHTNTHFFLLKPIEMALDKSQDVGKSGYL